MRRTPYFAAALLLALPAVARAQAFDFESLLEGYYPSVTLTSGTQTLTVTPEGSPSYFVNVRNFNVPLLGTRSAAGATVDPIVTTGQWAPLRFTFLQPVSSATFAFGDFGGESDTPVTIQAFSAGNALLGTFTTDYPEGFGAGKTLVAAVGGAGAKYFILSSGSEAFSGFPAGFNDNSIGWEIAASTIATAVPAPEPATLALTAGGLLALAGVARRRRAS